MQLDIYIYIYVIEHFQHMRLTMDFNLLPHALGSTYTSLEMSFYLVTTHKIRCERKLATAYGYTSYMTYMYIHPHTR